MSLEQEVCKPCSVGAPQVTEQEAQKLLTELSGWTITTAQGMNMLMKQYSFANFVEALAFGNRIGDLAEKANHHPEIRIEWGKVTLLWWTHKIGGLHKNDFILAAQSDTAL